MSLPDLEPGSEFQSVHQPDFSFLWVVLSNWRSISNLIGLPGVLPFASCRIFPVHRLLQPCPALCPSNLGRLSLLRLRSVIYKPAAHLRGTNSLPSLRHSFSLTLLALHFLPSRSQFKLCVIFSTKIFDYP